MLFKEETIKLKADGGIIGFSACKLALSKLVITGSSRRFLEKVFGKERFEEINHKTGILINGKYTFQKFYKLF